MYENRESEVRTALEAAGIAVPDDLPGLGSLADRLLAGQELTRAELLGAVAQHLGLRVVEVSALEPFAAVGGVAGVADAFGVYALADPFDAEARAQLEFWLDGCVEVVVADPEAIRQVNADVTPGGMLRKVTDLLRRAAEEGASDVHFEPGEEGMQVRWRADGELRPVEQWSREEGERALLCLKAMSGLELDVRTRPQDGRLEVPEVLGESDFRISALPGARGEGLVLRVLSRRLRFTLSSLGMPERARAELLRACRGGAGLVLACGPTGSGKTTTLYALLRELMSEEVKVVTVEDPIEYALPGAVQVQAEGVGGVGFAEVLRSVLRHDPEIILVGEVRDRATAAMATQAALTGHLVLATLHAPDAVGAVARLRDLGVKTSALAGTLRAVVGQRLARRVSGGRTGVFQVMRMTDGLREALLLGEPRERLEALTAGSGMPGLEAEAERLRGAGILRAEEE